MANTIDYVFLHGGTQAGWVWSDTVAALHQQSDGLVRAIALDIPGCGAKRGRDTANLGVDDIAAELLADVLATEMKDIVLVGHSQAGTILPRLVEERPDLFRRLVYVSCIAPLPGESVRQRPWAAPSPALERSGRRGGNESAADAPFDDKTVDIRDLLRPMFCNDMNEAESATFLAKLGQDSWPAQSVTVSDWRYDHLGRVPSSYVVCLKDAVLPVNWQETFASRLKVERLVRVDAGHQVMNTRPHALAEIIRYEAATDSRPSAASIN